MSRNRRGARPRRSGTCRPAGDRRKGPAARGGRTRHRTGARRSGRRAACPVRAPGWRRRRPGRRASRISSARSGSNAPSGRTRSPRMPVDTTSPCPVAAVNISPSAMSPPPLRRRFPCPTASRRGPAGLPAPSSLAGSCTGSSARLQCPKRPLVGHRAAGPGARPGKFGGIARRNGRRRARRRPRKPRNA